MPRWGFWSATRIGGTDIIEGTNSLFLKILQLNLNRRTSQLLGNVWDLYLLALAFHGSKIINQILEIIIKTIISSLKEVN